MPDKIRALAIGCHPDDIEFAMAGTMLNLQKAGCEIHFMTVANGSLGTNSQGRGDIAARRHAECLEAANLVGAVFHDPICDDIEVFYTYENICRVADVVREVDPSIILTHGPYDYMEDHVCTGKLAVTAAFCRGMANLRCRPGSVPSLRYVARYHWMPQSMTDHRNRPVEPDFYVDVTEEMETKREMLRRHASQKEWLDVSQGMDAYLEDMASRSLHYGRKSGCFEFAEGWIRHNPLGFCPQDYNPLVELLGKKVHAADTTDCRK